MPQMLSVFGVSSAAATHVSDCIFVFLSPIMGRKQTLKSNVTLESPG